MNLTTELRELKDEIRGYASEFGLDFFETFFELLDFDELNEVAAFGGFPTRYPHWRFGMEYEELSKGYSYGLQKIYEMVINNDPCYAYLMNCNALVDQKLVIAHVYGHSDFFKNNLWFSKTDRKMMDKMANHGTKIRRYIEKLGFEKVENFVDVCLALENLVDCHAPFVKRRDDRRARTAMNDEEESALRSGVVRLRSKEYMDRFINPPEFLEAQKQKLEDKIQRKKRFPEDKQKDVLEFLLEYAPLQRWEQEILAMIREEAYYFAPQGMTKIMNEGWATYWHSTLMTQRILDDSELIDYADHHSGTLGTRPGALNPYKVGVELFRDIEDRWNKGKFGKEFEECDDLVAKKNWNRDLGLGRQKIFEVRKIYNDVSFIDTFLNEDFCREQKLFIYRYNPRSGQYEIGDRDFAKVKEHLLYSLTNMGQPFVYVMDGNYSNRGELYLWHKWDGIDLRFDQALDTLKGIHRIWQRPVHLETKEEGRGRLLSFDGENTSIKEIAPSQ
jgi:stage V sporulation protein R